MAKSKKTKAITRGTRNFPVNMPEKLYGMIDEVADGLDISRGKLCRTILETVLRDDELLGDVWERSLQRDAADARKVLKGMRVEVGDVRVELD